MTTGRAADAGAGAARCPGERVLIAGNGPLNLQLACELLAGGVTPLAVVEAAPRPRPAAWRDRLGAWRALRRTWCARARHAADAEARRRAGAVVGARRRAATATGAAHGTCCGRAFDRRIEVDVVRAEPRLPAGDRPGPRARASGSASSMSGSGIWRPRRTRTAAPRCAGVFAVGDGAVIGGARVAPWRAAGWPGWRRRATSALPRRRTPRPGGAAPGAGLPAGAVAAVRPPRLRPGTLTDDTIVCRCEEVTAGRLRAELAGGLDLAGRAEEGDARRHGPLPGPLVLRPPSRGSAPTRRTRAPSPRRARRCGRCRPRR